MDIFHAQLLIFYTQYFELFQTHVRLIYFIKLRTRHAIQFCHVIVSLHRQTLSQLLKHFSLTSVNGKIGPPKRKEKSGRGRGVSTELNEGMFEWFNFLNFLNFLELFPFLPGTGFVLLYWFFGKLCNECHIYYKRCVGSFTNRYKVLVNSVLFCSAVLNVLACFTALCSELHTSSWRNIRLMNCAILFSFSP